LDLSPQTAEVSESFRDKIAELVSRNQFIGGKPVAEFEAAFAAYCGSKNCVALNSGTDALRLGLLACGIGPGDEVVTSPFTFIATGEAISQTGKLVLADVEPDTFTLCPDSVRQRLTSNTRAVIPVHIFGLPADMTRLGDLARSRGLAVVEDACQAHGAAIRGRKVGTLGDAAAFSFYPSKNLGAFGDAGALTTDDDTIAERVNLLRNHGQVSPYTHSMEGFNSRMDVFQASVLSLKLACLERWNETRRRLASLLQSLLSDLAAVRFQKVPEGFVHVYHVLGALVEDRDRLMGFLGSRGIDTRIIYPTPIHLMEAYRGLGLGPGSLPNAEAVCRNILCFPMYPGMTEGQVEEIAGAVRHFYGGIQV